MKKNKHTGSSFDDFFKEEDLYEEVTARALKKSSIHELKQKKNISRTKIQYLRRA